MLKPRGTINAAGTAERLDRLQAALRREAEGADADPFDEAVVAAALGASDALKAEAAALAKVGRWIRKAHGAVVN